ncbi:MAG: DUF2764 domain-containing protein [Bacteroidaceae bacterium]|nr:DUF2764 domain-containing protein [Bacteroidaceae bacterium]
MGNYYCLMTGSPLLKMGGEKPAISTQNIRLQLEDEMSDKDRKVIDTFFLKFDALNVGRLLQNQEAKLDERGLFSREVLNELLQGEAAPGFLTGDVPQFLKDFVAAYPEASKQPGFFVDDAAMLAYYDYARKIKNEQVAEWYELSYNVQCIMTALIARKNGWNVADYLKGNGEVCDMLRENNTADFGLSVKLDYMSQLAQIAELTDPVEKERQLDAFKWKWLDEQTFFDGFSVFAVFAYLSRLEMLERWSLLDPEQGKAKFEEIVENLRSEAKVPEEFRATNPYNKTANE